MSDWKGQVVVLNFWATWCIPCVAELPALDHLAADNPGITVLALSADRAGADAVRPFLAAHNITHATILLDPHMEAGRAFNVAGFPTTLIIDPSGHLRGRLEGPANRARRRRHHKIPSRLTSSFSRPFYGGGPGRGPTKPSKARKQASSFLKKKKQKTFAPKVSSKGGTSENLYKPSIFASFVAALTSRSSCYIFPGKRRHGA